VFVHPVTALRLMAHVGLAQDHDDAPAAAGKPPLRPQDDVVLLLRDAKGPLAEVEVCVRRTASRSSRIAPTRRASSWCPSGR